MAGGAATGAGLGIMGGILGGIGDIMSSAKYQRPSLPQPGGQEARLRSLAQGQLIGGGLESLAGTQLFNQLSPLMMGMVPGMKVTAAGGGGATGPGSPGATGGPAGTPMSDYQNALARYQNAVGRNQQLQNLQDQLKTMPKGPQKRATRQQMKALKKQAKADPTVPQLERQVYQSGTTPPSYNVTGTADQPGPVGSDLSPSAQSSLAQIMGWLHGTQNASGGTGGATPPSLGATGQFISDYNPSGTYTPPYSAPTSTP